MPYNKGGEMIPKIIARCWKKVIYFLVTGSTSVFIAACYGMPVGYGNLGKWVILLKNNENRPIQGLKVTVVQYRSDADFPDTLDASLSDSTGTSCHFLTTYNKKASHRHEAIIQDIDSIQNNGFFKDTIIVKTGSEESTVIMQPQK
jgi:hypothetical protein